jgi:hypothetical protein
MITADSRHVSRPSLSDQRMRRLLVGAPLLAVGAILAWIITMGSGEDQSTRGLLQPEIAPRKSDAPFSYRPAVTQLAEPGSSPAQEVFVAVSEEDDPAETLDQLVARLAETDPQAAWAWAISLPDDEPLKQGILLKTLVHSKGLDYASVATYAGSLPKGYGQFQEVVAGRWASLDPLAVSAWVSQLPEGEARERATTMLAAVWAETAPIKAADYVAQLPPGTTQGKAALFVLSYWAYRAPEEAALWMMGFGNAELRRKAIDQVMHAWIDTDAPSAAEWISAMEAGPDRDAAVVPLIRNFTSQDVSVAFQWAKTISAPDLRNAEMERILLPWVIEHPRAPGNSSDQ